MNRLFACLMGCLLIAMLAGCAIPGHKPSEESNVAAKPTVAIHDGDLNILLTYYQNIGRKDDQAIAKERDFYRGGLIEGRCDRTRMRFGLALLRAKERGMSTANDNQAMQPCVDDETLRRSSVQYLAHLIQAQLAQPEQVQDSAPDLQALQAENQELRRQVEGLKAIERSLQSRRRRE